MTTLLRVTLGILILASLAACSSATNAQGNGPPGGDLRPSADQAIGLEDDFRFTFPEGATVSDREWDVEIAYDSTDLDGIFAFYDDALRGLGFTQTEFDRDDDEIDSEYYRASDGVEIDLDVELEDGHIEVDLDADDLEGPYDVSSFTLGEFAGGDMPFYPGAEVLYVEWDFSFDHHGASPQQVFDLYDGQLRSIGWEPISIDRGDGDAYYRLDGVILELDVDDDDDGEVEVEIEVNKLRFY